MDWITNLMFIVGSIALIYGVGQFAPPLAWILIGGMLIGGSFLIAHRQGGEGEPKEQNQGEVSQ